MPKLFSVLNDFIWWNIANWRSVNYFLPQLRLPGVCQMGATSTTLVKPDIYFSFVLKGENTWVLLLLIRHTIVAAYLIPNN
jgi:hypothetical protein